MRYSGKRHVWVSAHAAGQHKSCNGWLQTSLHSSTSALDPYSVRSMVVSLSNMMPLSKLLVSPLVTPIVVPYITPSRSLDYGSHEIREPQYRPHNTMILIMGTPKKVPLILGNPHMMRECRHYLRGHGQG